MLTSTSAILATFRPLLTTLPPPDPQLPPLGRMLSSDVVGLDDQNSLRDDLTSVEHLIVLRLTLDSGLILTISHAFLGAFLTHFSSAPYRATDAA